jgi:uncharacterized protein
MARIKCIRLAAVFAAFAILCLSACASALPASLESRSYGLERSRGAALQEKADVLRIVHISDLHARFFSSLDAELLRRVAALAPDLILITGDTVTKEADFPVAERIVAGLGEGVPKLAVRGNWDLSTEKDAGRLAALFAAHAGRLLVNEYAVVELRGVKLLVYGADDMISGGFVPPAADELIPRAASQNPAAVFLLCHEPAFVDKLDKAILAMKGIYAFSGHTHGGQVTFFGAPVPGSLPEYSGRYVSGEYRVGSLRLFVSRGVGTSRIDFRFMARPDVMIYEL